MLNPFDVLYELVASLIRRRRIALMNEAWFRATYQSQKTFRNP